MPRTSLKQKQQLAKLRNLAALHSLEVAYTPGRGYAKIYARARAPVSGWSSEEVSLDGPLELWLAAVEKLTT